MNLSAADGIVLGALGMALFIVAGFFVFLAARRTWEVAKSMETALRAVPPLVEAVQELVAVAKDLRGELGYMRAVVTGGLIPEQPQQSEDGETTEPTSPVGRVPFPAPVYDRFTTKPLEEDAKLEDSEVISQTDAEMAEEEKLENLRQMGMAPLVDEPHRAREVTSL